MRPQEDETVSALTRFSLANRALIALVTVFVLIGGVIAAAGLRRELIPSLELPIVAVITPVPGSGANVIEEQVTRPLEAAVLAVPNVEKVESTSGDNLSSITVTLDYGTNLPDSQARIQRSVLAVRGLPDGSEPIVITGTFDDFPVMQLAASGDVDADELAERLRTQVVPELEDIAGVRSATTSGLGAKNVTITLDADKMEDAGVTSSTVAGALTSNGIVLPGGTISEGADELNVQIGTKLTSLDQIRALPLSDAGGGLGGLTLPGGVPGMGGGMLAVPAFTSAPTTGPATVTDSASETTAPDDAASREQGEVPESEQSSPADPRAPTSTSPATVVAPAQTPTTAPSDPPAPTGTPAPAPTSSPTPTSTSPAPTSTQAPRPTIPLPTNWPSNWPTELPTDFPTGFPTNLPTNLPTGFPTALPTNIPQFPQVPEIPQFPPMPQMPELPQIPVMPTIPTPTPTAPTITKLGDVATVELRAAELTSISRTDGRPSVGLAIVKVPGASTVDISHAVRDMIPRLEQTIPGGKLAVVFDQAPFIEQSISDLTHEGMLGLGMAVLVVFAFLLSVRLTLVTAISIPASLLAALIGLQVTGYTLNILTLGALTIAIGRVVDDSIVVVENIKRLLDLGYGRGEAILTGVREVAGAITASTIATVAVFLPIALVGGESGELFRPFAVTVGLAMGASLLIALTIVPVLAYWFVTPRTAPEAAPRTAPETAHPASDADAEPDTEGPLREAEAEAPGAAHDDEHAPPGRLERAYLPTLMFALRRPLVTTGVAVLALALAGAGATQLKTEFIGDAGQNSLAVTQQLPAGSTIAAVDEAAQKVEKVLTAHPQVQTTMATIGGGGAMFMGGGSNVARFSITLHEGVDSAALANELRAELSAIEGVGELSVGQAGMSMGASAVQIAVQAPDDAELRTASEQVAEAMKGVEGVVEVNSDLAEQVPTLAVRVDRAKALAKGVTEAQVGQKVSAAIEGRTVGRVELGSVDHDVVLREEAAPADVKAVEALVVGADYKGDDVLLRQVASVRRDLTPANIRRIDGNRAVVVSVEQAGDDLGALTRNIQSALDELTLPAGATATVGGAAADQQEAFSQLGLAMLAAIAITYVVMVATFGSLAQPFMLLISIPFAAIGAVAALLLTDTPLGVPAIVGLLMLVGVVVTNAIVLIDRVNQHRRAGLGVRQAVVLGARNRLRPIVMTAMATILALVPMAASLTGGGGFISQPLALVVIGGLISSTALTLLIVPVFYVLLENVLQRMRARRGDGTTA